MRNKLLREFFPNKIHLFISESKKRMYLITINNEGIITDYNKFNKEKNEGYFLIYDNE